MSYETQTLSDTSLIKVHVVTKHIPHNMTRINSHLSVYTFSFNALLGTKIVSLNLPKKGFTICKTPFYNHNWSVQPILVLEFEFTSHTHTHICIYLSQYIFISKQPFSHQSHVLVIRNCILDMLLTYFNLLSDAEETASLPLITLLVMKDGFKQHSKRLEIQSLSPL